MYVCMYMFWGGVFYSGLLNFSDPHIDRSLLGNGEKHEDQVDHVHADVKGVGEDEKMHMVDGPLTVHPSIEEHIIVRLPPTLHKGNIRLSCIRPKTIHNHGKWWPIKPVAVKTLLWRLLWTVLFTVECLTFSNVCFFASLCSPN